MQSTNTFKIVILGEGFLFPFYFPLKTFKGRVGKTSLTTKFCLGQFNEDEESTINASYLEKEVDIDGKKKTLAIWVQNILEIKCFKIN